MAPLTSFFDHLPWLTIFGLLGNTISFLVFLSPIPTFYTIYKKKSTEGFQCLPYVVALFSSMLWILYAFISPNSTFLKTINSFGLFIETVYIAIFLLYANREARKSTMKLILLMNVAGFGSVLFISMVIAKTTAVRIKILGWVCLIFALSVFVAPLGVMRLVIRTKSVKYMPFFLSFFLTLSAVAWFFYGLCKKDYYVAIPNVLGFTFGIIQMVLYAMYRNAKPTIEDIVEEKKIPEEIITPADHQIIQVVKLGHQELEETTAPRLSVINASRNVNANDRADGVYAIEIRNIDQEMMEKIKKTVGVGMEPAAAATPNLVTVAA